MENTYLIVTGWNTPYRETDHTAHTLELARGHKKELMDDLGFESREVCIVAIEGGDHSTAADEIDDLFREAKPFGRVRAAKLGMAHSCKIKFIF